jgi:endonuclease/exonuclease/phosphatase family metal-dependent hydrolase
MAGQQAALSFCWWNLHNFAHFDASRASESRWPKRAEDFEAKRDRILTTLQEWFEGIFPDLLAVCEVTREAASELAGRMSPAFDVAVAPLYPRDDGFQVAVIYRKGVGFSADLPLLPFEDLDVSEETRPMIPVQYTQAGQVIRFVACHWTSFDNARSRATRVRLADYLRGNTYEFLQPNTSGSPSNRHIVILGDLNEEPTAPVFEEHLVAARDHASGRQGAHWRDRNPRRVRLYNAAWRYLGEQVAYSGGTPTPGLAGTCFNDDLGWRTFDHLIVSGGLLSAPPPYLDEANTRVAATAGMRSPDGMIRPFELVGNPGISDHLPILGRIILSEGAI